MFHHNFDMWLNKYEKHNSLRNSYKTENVYACPNLTAKLLKYRLLLDHLIVHIDAIKKSSLYLRRGVRANIETIKRDIKLPKKLN